MQSRAMLYSDTYNRYKPKRVRIDSIGIGLSNDTFEHMLIPDTSYMWVGEQRTTQNGNYFNLQIDQHGLAINTTLHDRETIGQQYAAYIDGDVCITGTLYACNLVHLLSDSIVPNTTNTTNTTNDPIWSLAPNEAQNVFYPGLVTIGNMVAAESNQYPLNIVAASDSTIDRAQISIQNLNNAQLRIGIIGSGDRAPATFNTLNAVPIVFNVAKAQNFYDCLYRQSFYDNNGFYLSNTTVPDPVYSDSNLAPHLTIDANGNVGIHTNQTRTMTFTQRQVVDSSGRLSFSTKTEYVKLEVNGALYASNILLQDPDSGTPKHIDDLYVRRLGVTFKANQIEPGRFAAGDYQFPNNLSVDSNLAVRGLTTLSNLAVDANVTTSNATTDHLTVNNASTFVGDINANADVIVKNSLRLRGDILTETLDAGGNLTWQKIQYTVASPNLSNINLYGQGITTPGRFGAGITKTDPVNHQLVIKKRQLDNFELELSDRADWKLYKTALIGHQKSLNRPNDGSLIIATPPDADPAYTRGYETAHQNIYLYPGAEIDSINPIIDSNLPPTLGAFQNRRVGINTFNPKATLDVQGSIYIASDIIINDPTVNEDVVMGLWKHIEQSNPLVAGVETFKSMVYIRPGVEHIGVHTIADINYGMTIAGGLQSVHGYYTGLGQEIVPWIRQGEPVEHLTTPCGLKFPNPNMYTLFHCGVGVTEPEANLDIKACLPGEATTIRLRTSDFGPATALNLRGTVADWNVVHNNSVATQPRFEIFSRTSQNATIDDNAKRALWANWTSNTDQYSVFIGASIADANAATNPNHNATLTVGGDLSVMGNIDVYGQYHMRGQVMINSGMNDNPVVLEKNDIFIGGNDIYLNPDGAVLVGYTTAERRNGSERYETAMLRVYQPNALDPKKALARFITESDTGLIDLVCKGNNQTLRFGAYGGTLAFLDGNYNRYLSFYKSPIDQTQYLGINTATPTAQLQITTSATGSNMLKLTKLYSADGPFAAPELEFEKIVADQPTTPLRWTIHGPESSYGQKLSFLFTGSNDLTGQYCSRREVFNITNDACVGIGTVTPEYALDVYGEAKQATVKIHSIPMADGSELACPQLLFISGAKETFGADAAIDYRLYSYDNEFRIESEALNRVHTLFFAGSNNQIGINTTNVYEGPYAMTVGGNLNVVDSIYLNGSPIFSTSGAFGDVNLRAYNLYLSPKVFLGGGVVLNNTDVSPGDLFHIYSGSNANIMTLDSSFEDVHIDLRTVNSNVYRLGMSNETFYLEYNSNISDGAIPDGHDQGWTNAIKVSAQAPPYPGQEFSITMTGELTVNSATDPRITIGAANIRNVTSNLILSAASNTTTDSIGCVGIGTDWPMAGLHVCTTFAATGTIAGDDLGIHVDDLGNVGIGTAVPKNDCPFTVYYDSCFDSHVEFTSNVFFSANTETNGNAYVHGNTVTDSDARLKTNLKTLDDSLAKVCSLTGYSYNLIADLDGPRQLGLLAQEVATVFPEAVSENKTSGRLGVSYGNMVAALVQAIKELNAKLEVLMAK